MVQSIYNWLNHFAVRCSVISICIESFLFIVSINFNREAPQLDGWTACFIRTLLALSIAKIVFVGRHRTHITNGHHTRYAWIFSIGTVAERTIVLHSGRRRYLPDKLDAIFINIRREFVPFSTSRKSGWIIKSTIRCPDCSTSCSPRWSSWRTF